MVVALAALLALVSIAPVVQTWVAQLALARQSGQHGSIRALSARFGEVQIADLHLEREGAIVTIPYLDARLPLTTALLKRKLVVRNLVARGWTLDLSHRSDTQNAPTPAGTGPERAEGSAALPPATVAPAQEVLRVFRGILRGGQLPCDLSLDGVDLEGDVVVADGLGNPPARVHVIVKGDGVAAGRESALAIDATGEFHDSRGRTIDLAVHGRLAVAMDSPRTLNRVELKADLSAEGRLFPKGFACSVDIAAARGASDETYTLDLSRDSRRVVTVLVRAPAAPGRLVGTWKVDLRDSDLAPFMPDRPLPSVAAEGEGDVGADAAFTRVHALGRLNIVAGRLGVLVPPLDFLGTVTADARFDVVRSGQSIRVDRLSVSLAGPGRTAVVQALQPFDCDERTGHLTVADPSKDWMEASIGAMSLVGLPDLLEGFSFVGGNATGELVARVPSGGLALRSKTPLIVTGVAVQHAGKMIGHGLDLSLPLLADFNSDGWKMECAPLTVGSAGQHLATIEAKVVRPAKAGQPATIAGTWNADLKALASQSAIPGAGWITARSASGDFSASVGMSTDVAGKLVVIGPAADQSISVNFQAGIGADLAVAFRAPIKITVGSGVSEVTAEGTWVGETAGDRLNLSLTGANVALEHLQQLVAPLVAMGGAPLNAGTSAGTGGPQTPAAGRDRAPFWGDWVGGMTVAFDRLKAGDEDLNGVRGTFDFDHGSIRLQNGLWELPNQSLAKAEGLISFDAAAASPYGVKAAAALGEVDAAPLFGDPPSGRDPAFKGRFSVAMTLTGSGNNLDDLVARIEQEYRLTSTNGIVRLLRTNVADTIPEAAAPVSDALDTAGAAVGAIFGLKRGAVRSGEKHVSKNTEAVIGFTYLISEIGYDQIVITARRGPDRTIHLVEIAMTGRDVHVTGSGQIDFVKGWSFPVEPLSVELQLGVRGKLAPLLATAGLLSARKDEQGYTLLNQPVRFGGTMQHIDETQWHDLLAKAAAPKPDEGKKDSTPAAGKK